MKVSDEVTLAVLSTTTELVQAFKVVSLHAGRSTFDLKDLEAFKLAIQKVRIACSLAVLEINL